ncbi:MAG: hypothetical protein LW636_09965 [Planctomycetaceae bacterium]|nr:hypothetical protein [Planctomycetaceae bacterium]
MSKNAMAGAVTLCGVGLCTIGGAMALQGGPHAYGSALPQAAGAIVAAASAQAGGEPTVVWYGTYGGNYGGYIGGALLRAWSDGTVEMKKLTSFSSSASDACNSNTPCSSPWLVISSPTAGFRAAADLNADELVNGADLATVLSNWGEAPRVPFPPSDCPLDLVVP